MQLLKKHIPSHGRDVTVIISRIFENATATRELSGIGAGVGSTAPHLTCGAATDKRASSDSQTGIVDVSVDDPV
jgi:hypothetical protein